MKKILSATLLIIFCLNLFEFKTFALTSKTALLGKDNSKSKAVVVNNLSSKIDEAEKQIKRNKVISSESIIKSITLSEDKESIIVEGKLNSNSFKFVGMFKKFREFDDIVFANLIDEYSNFESIYFSLSKKASKKNISVYNEQVNWENIISVYIRDKKGNNSIFIDEDANNYFNNETINSIINSTKEQISYEDIFWISKVFEPSAIEEGNLEVDLTLGRGLVENPARISILSGEKSKNVDKSYNIYYSLAGTQYKEVLVVRHTLSTPSSDEGSVGGIISIYMAYTYDVTNSRKYSESTTSKLGYNKLNLIIGADAPFRYTWYTWGGITQSGGTLNWKCDASVSLYTWKSFGVSGGLQWTPVVYNSYGDIYIPSGKQSSAKSSKIDGNYLMDEGQQFNIRGTLVLDTGYGAGYSNIYAGFEYDIYTNANGTTLTKNVEIADSVYRSR